MTGVIVIAGLAIVVALVTVAHRGAQRSQSVGSDTVIPVVAMGASVAAADSSGLATVTVQSLTVPVAPANSVEEPSHGSEYAVAKVEACSGKLGSPSGAHDSLFSLGLKGGRRTSVHSPVETPDLGGIGGIAPGACAIGFVSFELPAGSTPAFVTYQSGRGQQYRWSAA